MYLLTNIPQREKLANMKGFIYFLNYNHLYLETNLFRVSARVKSAFYIIHLADVVS